MKLWDRRTMGQSIPQHDTAKHVEKNIQKKTKGFYGSDRSRIETFRASNIPTTFPFRPGKAMSPIEIMIPGEVARGFFDWKWRCQLDVNWMSIGCQLKPTS